MIILKRFSELGYRVNKARARYRDVMDAYKDPKYLEQERESAKEHLKYAQEEAVFDDRNREITFPGGHKQKYKDDLRYKVAKEQQKRASRSVIKDAFKYYEDVNSDKTPRQRARKEAIKALIGK